MKRGLVILAGAILVGGCMVGPDYVRPPAPELPEAIETLPSGESIANLPWWEVFEDTVLVDLIQSSLENNRDLTTTVARIEEARAQLGITRAGLFPRVDYGASGGASGNTETDDVTWDAIASVQVSYQVDLWGRIRRANEAALQELLASEEAYRSLTISLVSEVAQAYMLLRDLDNRLSISEETLETWRQHVEVIRSRFDAGMVSEVDVNQAEIQVFEAEVSVQTFERLRVQTENTLSVLLGTAPGAIPRGPSLEEQELLLEVPVHLPSDLLSRRPDIIEAERHLHAQTARIGVAQALRFPQFDLLGTLGGQFDGGQVGFFDIGAQVFGPLWNAGENRRRVDVEVARTEQLVQRYEQTILLAYREVGDAAVAVRTYRAEYASRSNQVEAARNAALLSWVRYEGGLTSYLEVLDLQRSLFSSQLKASETRQRVLSSTVQLYAALGGGWVPEQDQAVGLGTRGND